MEKCIRTILILAISHQSAMAGIIAVNSDVPAVMDSNAGVEGNPATYVFDNYIRTFDGLGIVGKTQPHIHLIIRNGSVITFEHEQWATTWIGEQAGASNNTLTVTGVGTIVNITSRLDTATHSFKVGNTAPGNVLRILDGATMNTKRIELLGASGGSSIVISGASVSILDRIYAAGSGSVGNTFSLAKGGTLVASAGNKRFEFAGTSTNNYAEVKDFGTVLDCDLFSFDGQSNVMAVIDAGLIKCHAVGNWQNRPKQSTSFYHFGGGFLAWKGDQARLDYDKDIKLWDGTAWVRPTTLAQAEALGWSKTLHTTDEAALAATGYDGLAGYTVFTGGLRRNPLPPVTTCIVIR